MSDFRKRLEAKGIKFKSPSHPIDNSESIISFPGQQECCEQQPREQVPPWEAACGPNLAEVWVLHPTLLYPDLQNLPFDPAEVALKQLERTRMKAERLLSKQNTED